MTNRYIETPNKWVVAAPKKKRFRDIKLVRESVGIGSVFVVLIGGSALLGGVGLGAVALSIYLTPWTFIFTVPVGIAIMAVGMAGLTRFLDKAMKWANQ